MLPDSWDGGWLPLSQFTFDLAGRVYKKQALAQIILGI
jgi:hypothetical protein